ncbi:MAG: MobC family plasmid mobilization relaxosome protein [Alphaproteobacteria bacterium]|nr:MobC family plasmid mobilization relaxosome protein [Alphaproteobacteria bacterium]MBM3641088.1 MobC family plasmid mobilization relaxosome protein [Alphaproteobacteria bacterium]MBM3652648.1 MobC family plasmid mobilization relaxosome protein [Alphaproteobacteria bacterium]
MALISLRIPDDLAARFSAMALSEGGKSALLRRLIGEVLEARPSTSVPLPIGKPQKITLRLRDSEMRQLADIAHRRGMTRTGWIVALVRARLGAPIQSSPGEREALRAIMRELNRIGANINQIARAANGGAMHGAAVDVDLSDIREVKAVVEKTLAELRRIFDDNASYWEGRR